MSCISHVASYSAAILRGTSNFIARSNLHNQSNTPWKTNSRHLGIKSLDLDFLLARFRVQSYSSRSSSIKKSRPRKLKIEPEMEQENDEFFVLRKGDVVGVYKSLTECQAQVGTSICHPPVSVYKGYSLPKGTEEYLTSHGLKNALYTIRAADLTEDLFGSLLPCDLQDPTSTKRPHDMIGPEIGVQDELGSMSALADPLRKHVKLDHDAEAQAVSSRRSCVIEFDGASKGNPGPAGAAAVLRTEDGSLVAGSWKTRHQGMADLCEEAKRLKDKFLSFQITHVLRDLNSEADAQANLAINLADGQVAAEYAM